MGARQNSHIRIILEYIAKKVEEFKPQERGAK